MANQLGKVYICGNCDSQVIVTKGGTGAAQVLRRPDGTEKVSEPNCLARGASTNGKLNPSDAGSAKHRAPAPTKAGSK